MQSHISGTVNGYFFIGFIYHVVNLKSGNESWD
jgi:hypothetical protein